MEETETPHPDYVKGFNEGYIIAQQMPELAKELDKALSNSPRSQGFQAGKQQYGVEKSKERLPSFLQSDRFSALDKEDYLSRGKDIDKDIDEPDKD